MSLAGVGKSLISFGATLVALGLGFLAASRFGLTGLPGDFTFKIGAVRVFVPLASSVVLSIVLTLLLRWLGGGR